MQQLGSRFLFAKHDDSVLTFEIIKFVCLLYVKNMPSTNIIVNRLVRLVWVKDIESVACSSCPDCEFQTLGQALVHSLKHRVDAATNIQILQ